MTAVSIYHWNEAELNLIEAVKNHQIICYPHFRGSKSEINQIWYNISQETNIPASTCRARWSAMKRRYIKWISSARQPGARSKYLDGTLSFLDTYYKNTSPLLTPSKAVHDVVVIEPDEDLDDEKDYMVLDLEMIDNLLEKRGSHEDIEMARMEEILSLVSKRIEETLALHPHLNQTQKTVTEPQIPASASEKSVTSDVSEQYVEIDTPADIIDLDDDEESDDASDSQSSHGEDMETETSENFPHAVRAFSTLSQNKPASVEMISRIPIASMSIPMTEKPAPKTVDDMETIFDIHRRSDSKTFFQELGRYLERFSKEKQDEIRLKICCLVTEVELEEID